MSRSPLRCATLTFPLIFFLIPAAAWSQQPPNGDAPQARGKSLQNTFDAWRDLSKAQDPMVVRMAVEQLGKMAALSDADDLLPQVRVSAQERLLAISSLGDTPTREAYAAVDALYGARFRVAPELAGRLDTRSRDYIRGGKLLLLTPSIPSRPPRATVFEDEVVTAGLLRVISEGLVNNGNLTFKDPKTEKDYAAALCRNAVEFIGFVRLLTAAVESETGSPYVRHAAANGLVSLESATKLGDDFIIELMNYVIGRRSGGPPNFVAAAHHDSDVEVFLIRLAANQTTVEEKNRPALSEKYAIIADRYRAEKPVIAALADALKKLHSLIPPVVAAGGTVIGAGAAAAIAANAAGDKPAGDADTKKETADKPTAATPPANSFFVSTQVKSAVGLASNSTDVAGANAVTAATDVPGALTGPRPRLDDAMKRVRVIDPIHQPGLRSMHAKFDFSAKSKFTQAGAKDAAGVTNFKPTPVPKP